MTAEHHRSSLHVRLSVWIDALTYASAVAAIATITALLLGLVTGGGPSQAKLTLFFVGFLLLGYATVRLWPSTPGDLDSSTELAGVEGDSIPETADKTRFQAFVQQLPPLRWVQSPPPEARMRAPGKLLLGSITILLVSFLMEAVFGI
ncbi:uncharacterized protein Nmag_2486 [Natrialba magadii ATCC 43099]|uniref:Uncharacterized protein n=1 Tax=Natrialba magadii (strain ATCC 43099 / DSM 3394 / CCM 3739 / CIP 104546 / IAM 13178 / JCM 8861 / NBRC 102185 / NCIMB 2190 / MS3) TaxID=547559 RepID=D3SY75_NATMM|nr:hypothetical protein [Natrialba magadii]ADD06046.1 uncharacterized protein Nmag_2486 [Natrialba magadii ATCC 43099]ELY30957.1 hypothetical protein C500_07963 [Natrialba magadii ATCC 43099]